MSIEADEGIFSRVFEGAYLFYLVFLSKIIEVSKELSENMLNSRY
jgi:hypothetical protein